MLDKLMELAGSIRWSSAVNIAAYNCNYESFHELKNCCKGREIAICGAGPSLNKYQPIPGAVHIALNRALLYEKVKYDFFMADDWVGISFMQDIIKNYSCKKYMGYHCGNIDFREIPESFRIEAGAKKYYTDSHIFSEKHSRLVVDIDRMPISVTYNIGLQVMQIALFMNPTRVYLVGIDASVDGHFTNKGINEKNVKTIDADLNSYVKGDVVRRRWDEVKKFRDVYYPKTEIISINPVGLRGIFVDQYQDVDN